MRLTPLATARSDTSADPKPCRLVGVSVSPNSPSRKVLSRGPRRSLPFRGGPATPHGDPAFSRPLIEAFDAQERAEDLGVLHRFHSYPARMHPALVRRLLEALHPGRAASVLDPFCGSGTVAMEAMRAGWRSVGSDLNPLALSLCRVKSQVLRPKVWPALLHVAEEVTESSLERVQDRVPVVAKISREEIRWYSPHVLKELAGLLEEIRQVPDPAIRGCLEMVFSAIVVKFSNQRADTRQETQVKRIRKGLVSEFFFRKSQELVADWEAFAQELPGGVKEPSFVATDARRVHQTLGGSFFADLVLSSPPYAGTYDYASHHARRIAWLGLKDKALHRQEIGARRDFERAGPGASARWDRQLHGVLCSLAQVQRPDALLVFLMGDGEINGRPVDARKQLEAMGPDCGYRYLASVRQPRPDPRRPSASRGEHLIVLTRNDSAVRVPKNPDAGPSPSPRQVRRKPRPSGRR